MMGNCLVMMVTAAIVVVIIIILAHFLFLDALLQMHFSMSFLLVRSGELTAASVALERFLSSVSSK